MGKLRQEKTVGREEDLFGGYKYVMQPEINSLTEFNLKDEIEDEETEKGGLDGMDGSLKIRSNIGYAQAQYFCNMVDREYIERFENSLREKSAQLEKIHPMSTPLRKSKQQF